MLYSFIDKSTCDSVRVVMGTEIEDGNNVKYAYLFVNNQNIDKTNITDGKDIETKIQNMYNKWYLRPFGDV